MAKRRSSRSRRLVLDVGSSAVRLCELTQTKAGYQLTKYYQREFPIDPSMEEEEKREVRKATLQALLKEAKVRHKKTVLGVPGQSVFTRPRALPPVPEYKLSQIVRYEIQQLIPFPLENVAWGYQVLNVTDAGGYDVLMAAIKVDVVEKRLEILRDVKKSIDVVDVCPLAAYNWFKYTGEFGEQGETVALLDLGAATTDIVIEREGQFRFTRSLNIGGNDVTKAVAEGFNMEWAKAEQLKREKGFAPTGDPQRDGKGGEVIGKVLSRLVGEINRSFGYFRAQPGGGPVSRVVVTGGGACLRNIIPFLQRQLGVEVRIAQPLAGLAIAPGAQEVNDRPEQAAVALGLSLRCRESVPLEINLIPPRILEAARRREQVFYWALSVATLLLIMASIIPARAQQNEQTQKEIQLATTVLGQYDGRMIMQPGSPADWTSTYETELAQFQKQIDIEKTKQILLDRAHNDRIVWVQYLNALNDARPKGKLVVFSVIESSVIRPVGGGGRGGGLGRGGRGGPGVAQAATTPPQQRISSTGFEGLGANRLFSDTTLGGNNNNAPAPREPNGLRVRGYVSDQETLQEFLENLRETEEFGPDGVFFDQQWTEPVPESVLFNAPTDIPGAAAPARVAGGGRNDDDDGGFGGGFAGLQNYARSNRGASGRGGRGGGAGMTPGGMIVDPTANTILTFTVDVQFGEAVQPTQGPRRGGGLGGGGRRPGAQGFNFRINRGDDE